MRITSFVTALVLLAAVPANAAFVSLAGNNTQATATPLVSNTADWNSASCAFSADVGFGTLAAGGVDWFTMTIPNGCIVTAITTPLGGLPGNFASPDTLMAIVDPLGVAALNDDGGSDGSWSAGPVGPTRGSAIRYLNDSGGALQVWIAVSGFPDFGLDGSHGEAGNYLLTVSLFPEPTTLVLLAGGALFLIRRRR